MTPFLHTMDCTRTFTKSKFRSKRQRAKNPRCLLKNYNGLQSRQKDAASKADQQSQKSNWYRQKAKRAHPETCIQFHQWLRDQNQYRFEYPSNWRLVKPFADSGILLLRPSTKHQYPNTI